ncbi:MAG: hypothetical protein Q9178_002463 [Gyalolechia marmorata]
MAKLGKSKKLGNDSTPVAPKDIKGDVTTENELSPKDAAAPRSSRKRAGDFNDFEEDEAVIGDATKETNASPTQPKKKSKTTSAAEKKAKPSKTDGNTALTEKLHPGGDRVEKEPAEESTTQRKTSRKSAGKSKAAKEDEKSAEVGKDTVTEDVKPPSKKKAKTNKADTKSGKTDAKSGKADAKLSKTDVKPSKTDGHPVVTEKTHPGGDMVETELVEDSPIQKKTGKKPGRKSKAEKQNQESTTVEMDVATEEAEPPKEKGASKRKDERATKSKSSAKVDATEKAAQKGKSKSDGDKAKDTSHAEEVPHKVTAPKKTKEPTTDESKSKSKSQKSKKSTDAEPKADTAKGRAKAAKSDKAVETKDDQDEAPKVNKSKRKDKAPKSDKDEEPKANKSKGTEKAPKSGKATESEDKAEGEQSNKAAEEDTAAVPDEAMDEAPFTNLLKRERAKIPSVKASANAAEAERKGHTAAEASKASDKPAKASKTKEPKPASKEKKAVDTENPAGASKAGASKGKKRKDGPEGADTKAESAPSDKKQKKTRPSALEAATGAVGNLVHSGIEAAAQGVSVVKDLASGLGNKSLVEDVTAVAEDAVEANSKEDDVQSGDGEKVAQADKGKRKEKPVEEDISANGSDVDEGEEHDDYEEGDQTMALIKGFESQEEDDGPSMGEGFKEGQTVPELPNKKDVQKQLEAVKESSDTPGVVYVGRIPHGFYESQMRAYFGQFGHISRLRLSRNRTTGNSKHYAFIEFASSAVAEVVAKTMDTYLMFGHILKCKLVAPGDVHENLWKGANKRFKKVPWSKIEGRKLERKVGREEWGKRVEGERKKREKKSEKLKSIGYEFEAPKLKGPEDVPIREGEKGIEGPSADGGTIEEKTIVTTDGVDGTVVISEEVKTTKVKKGGKRKAEEKVEEGPLAEVVKKAKKAKKNVA